MDKKKKKNGGCWVRFSVKNTNKAGLIIICKKFTKEQK